MARTKSAPPTAAAASSSAPGRLLSTPVASDGGTDRGSSAGWGLRDEARKLFKTPTSNLGSNGGSQHPDKRKAGGHGPTLADEVEHLLPTPAARDWKSGESNLMDRNSRPLNEVVVNCLPSPTSPSARPADAASGCTTPEDSAQDATAAPTANSDGQVKLLPTPAASNPNDGESLESWEARRQRNLAKGINGNGQGTPLAIAVKLLPTPMAGDAKGTRNATAGRKRDNPNVNPGWTLSDVVYDGQLLPTPTASATEKSTRALTSSTGNGRRTGGGQSSSLGLTEIAKLATGERPANLPANEDLPPSSRRIVEQFSTSEKATPTSNGAITNPPSAAGSESSDDEPPGQPTLWDV